MALQSPYFAFLFVTLCLRWSVLVGQSELLAVKTANLLPVSAQEELAKECTSWCTSVLCPLPATQSGSKCTYTSTLGFFSIVLFPDATICCHGGPFFDISLPPAPAALTALPLEAQLAVCCSSVKPSATILHSLLSRMPPATVDLVRIPGLSFTLLEFAADNGQLEVVEALLSFGADVNIQTPCLWAASKGHIQVIDTLTQHGAVPSRERGFDGVSSHTTAVTLQHVTPLTRQCRQHLCIMRPWIHISKRLSIWFKMAVVFCQLMTEERQPLMLPRCDTTLNVTRVQCASL